MFVAHIKKDGTEQSCKEHCENTARIVSADIESLGLKNTGYLVGLLHDCGKFTKEFTEYIRKAEKGEAVSRGSIIHSFAGVSLLLKSFHNSENELYKLNSELLSCAIGGHHGLFDCANESNENGFDHRINRQPDYDWTSIENFLNDCMPNRNITELFDKSVEELSKEVQSLRVLCEKSARKKEDLCFLLSLSTRMITSSLVDADRKDTASFVNDDSFPKFSESTKRWKDCLENFESFMNTFPQKKLIHKARQELSDLCSDFSEKSTGIYRLNIPTGGGKTLSSLRYALLHALKYKKEHIFYVSPLLSILEQNADIIRKAVGNDDIVLEHHSDVVNEGETKENLERQELLTNTWDAPIIITTLVQLLNTMFSGKMSSVRRFHSLKNSVVIIDEVQTVPSKLLTMFNLVLDYFSNMCNTTFILCSATQPEFEMIPHPISAEPIIKKEVLAKYNEVFKRTTIEFKDRCRLNEIDKYILELKKKYRNVLVVCNKKREATELFDKVNNLGIKCYYLSAGMCVAHRKKTIRQIEESIESKEEFICISTQVIEAGVDISFESAIRFSAGMDNIIQTAGRCNRNGEKETLSPVWIIDCIDENLSKLKDIQKAKNSTNALIDLYMRTPKEYSYDLASDASISRYYTKLYNGEAEGFFDYTLNDGYSIYNMLSCNKKWKNNSYLMNQAFRTAGENFKVFDSEQRNVIVPYEKGKEIADALLLEEADDIEMLLAKAAPYTVNVYEYQFNKMIESGALQMCVDNRVAVLTDDFYDKNIGIKEVTDECNIQIW